MTCPVCQTEFDSPILKEISKQGGEVFCPLGHKLRFVTFWSLQLVETQIEELEQLYAL
jgi:hypothetical protein